MELKIKKYEYKETEVDSMIFELPEKPVYFFETGIRRSIRIIPVFTEWRKQDGKDEELFKFEITCVYSSFECWAEKFEVNVSQIERLYYSEDKRDEASFIKNWIDNFFDVRTEEQFNCDLSSFLDGIK